MNAKISDLEEHLNFKHGVELEREEQNVSEVFIMHFTLNKESVLD